MYVEDETTNGDTDGILALEPHNVEDFDELAPDVDDALGKMFFPPLLPLEPEQT